MSIAKLLDNCYLKNLYWEEYETIYEIITPWTIDDKHLVDYQECAILYTQLILQFSIAIIISDEGENIKFLNTIVSRILTFTKQFIRNLKKENASLFVAASTHFKKFHHISDVPLGYLFLPMTIEINRKNSDYNLLRTIVSTLNERVETCVLRIKSEKTYTTFGEQTSFDFVKKSLIGLNLRGKERKRTKKLNNETIIKNVSLFTTIS